VAKSKTTSIENDFLFETTFFDRLDVSAIGRYYDHMILVKSVFRKGNIEIDCWIEKYVRILKDNSYSSIWKELNEKSELARQVSMSLKIEVMMVMQLSSFTVLTDTDVSRTQNQAITFDLLYSNSICVLKAIKMYLELHGKSKVAVEVQKIYEKFKSEQKVYNKEMNDECKQKVYNKDVNNECQQRMPNNNTNDECKQRIHNNDTNDECKQRIHNNNSIDECKQRIHHNNTNDECKQRMPNNEINNECKQRIHHNDTDVHIDIKTLDASRTVIERELSNAISMNNKKLTQLVLDELNGSTLKQNVSELLDHLRTDTLTDFTIYLMSIFERAADQNKTSKVISTRKELNTSVSFCFEEDDPYFILQPLKIEKLLPLKQSDSRALTLVLDLDETLVHFTENETNGKFLVRPFAREFLVKLSDYYELVVFTAALKDYADWILDRIDTNGNIKFRLYRDHTTFQNGVYLKDLSKLNRDLARTIIVDNNPDNFQMHPENGIYIKSWYEDPNDVALKHLANVLVKIASGSEKDVRVSLANFNRKINNIIKEV
jgi:Dullard-like phosphatase family protein